MKLKKLVFLLLICVCLTSCLGDKKTVNVSEMNDISFVNKNFKDNLINYSKDMSACENMSPNSIASLYNVSENMVLFEDVSKSDRRVPNSSPICSFFIKDGENDFQWLRGSISIQREIGKDEIAYDVAKAVGHGVEWKEAWALNKSISKSSVWLKGIGLAAVWNDKNKELKIKFKGYILYVNPLKNGLNKAEIAKNRDYKKVAIAMAKAAGYIK